MNSSFRSFWESVASLPVDQRLKFGINAENQVIAILEKMIGPVKTSSKFEDQTKKVDAYVTNRMNGETVLAQIKGRQSGSDILVEWYKIWERGVEGRDKIGNVKLYVTMNNTRSMVYLISADLVKSVCENMFHAWQSRNMPPVLTTADGQVRLQQSYDIPNVHKVIMYLKPDKLRGKPLPGWPSAINVPAAMRDMDVTRDPRSI